ncbi:MAG: DUF2167 domain-containing protein [Planctomycetes bacterium]|nr:DUF2167 domain-containing protein [Planctomycetota bacterium]
MSRLSKALAFACIHLFLGASMSASPLSTARGQETAEDGSRADEAPEQDAAGKNAEPVALDITIETGKVKVRDHATIDLPDGWGYLQTKDARFVVEKVWGNPPDAGVLGLVIPSMSKDPREWAYGIITSFEDEGYVKDDDAKDTDYDALLADMQEGMKESNKQRKKAGYGTVDLVGWAERPHYDSAQKKLYWAKTLRFDDEPSTVLNYDVRILGRHGYLVLQAVAQSDQLTEVAEGSKAVLARTEFVDGKRYEDFDSSIDKVAAYGIGGLIAGKVLLKAGILKVLLKPLLIVGAVVVAAAAKLFGKKKAVEPTTEG